MGEGRTWKRRAPDAYPRRTAAKAPPSTLCHALARSVLYTGNPQHKRNPADFGLTPPAQPRLTKQLCDSSGVFRKMDAPNLLREGARRGLFSARMGPGDRFPKQIWAVTDEGIALEAQLENPGKGEYHGYTFILGDPFADEVIRLWNAAETEVRTQ